MAGQAGGRGGCCMHDDRSLKKNVPIFYRTYLSRLNKTACCMALGETRNAHAGEGECRCFAFVFQSSRG